MAAAPEIIKNLMQSAKQRQKCPRKTKSIEFMAKTHFAMPTTPSLGTPPAIVPPNIFGRAAALARHPTNKSANGATSPASA